MLHVIFVQFSYNQCYTWYLSSFLIINVTRDFCPVSLNQCYTWFLSSFLIINVTRDFCPVFLQSMLHVIFVQFSYNQCYTWFAQTKFQTLLFETKTQFENCLCLPRYAICRKFLARTKGKVKICLSRYGRNIGWGFSRVGFWRRKSGLRWTEWKNAGINCVTRSVIIGTKYWVLLAWLSQDKLDGRGMWREWGSR
jgi:hypothetical protein